MKKSLPFHHQRLLRENTMNSTDTLLNESSDEILLKEIAHSNETAFEIAVNRYAMLVESAATASQLDASEVPHLIQATFIVFWDRRESLPPAPKLGGWLYGVTSNLARNYIRSRSRTRKREQAWQLHEYETMNHNTNFSQDSQIPVEHRQTLHRSLEKLSETSRQIIIARFWQKKTFAAIGQELGCSEDAAKKRFSTALMKMRGLFVAAGLSSTATAAVENLLESEAAMSSVHAGVARATLLRHSTAARNIANLYKAEVALFPAIIGCIATFTAIIIACKLITTSGTEKDHSTSAPEFLTSQTKSSRVTTKPSHTRKKALIPISEWKSSAPTVLLKAPADDESDHNIDIWHYPLPILWQNRTPFLPVMSGFKGRNSKFHLFKNSDGTWEETVTIEGLHFPTLVAVSDGSMGIVGHSGERPGSSNGASLLYYRYDPQSGVSEPSVLTTPPTPDARITFLGMSESGMQLSAVMMLDLRGNAKNQLLESVSSDGGRTWSKPLIRMETNMSGDYDSRINIIQLGQEGFGVFHQESAKSLELLVASPNGDDWESRPIVLTDELPKESEREPLSAISTPTGITLAYLTLEESNNDRTVTYFTSTSKDSGRTWSKGLPIAKIDKDNDDGEIFQLTSNGSQLIANYVDITMPKGTFSFEAKWLASDNNGQTWTDLPEADTKSLIRTASFSPSGNRAYIAEVIPGTKEKPESLQVRELVSPSK
jgi:RNA polymerase sigma factor (sigma-70 family)